MTKSQEKVRQTAGHDALGEFAPEFAHLNDDILFGEVWSRNDLLSLRDRSIVTVVALMSQGVTDASFKNHLESAKKNMKLATWVRAYGNVKIMAAGRVVADDTGEIQFTDYGISGIPVFQVSRFAVRAMEEGQRVEALVDVAADIKEDDLLSML